MGTGSPGGVLLLLLGNIDHTRDLSNPGHVPGMAPGAEQGKFRNTARVIPEQDRDPAVMAGPLWNRSVEMAIMDPSNSSPQARRHAPASNQDTQV